MNLNRENMYKIMQLIAFAILLYVGVQNIDVVTESLLFVWGLLFPFALGGAIAFVLNVPMKFIERNLFGKAKKKNSKTAKKLARPASLLLAILLVLMIVMIVVLVVLPELVATLVNVARTVERFVPQLQKWIGQTFEENPQIVSWAASIEVSPEEFLTSVTEVLKNGVNNILSSTFSLAMGIFGTALNFGIGFIFSCYILLSKERLSLQCKKALYALAPRRIVEEIIEIFRLTNKTFSGFITGQCMEAVVLGTMFFVSMTLFRLPYAMLVGVLISFTALIPIFGAFIGCVIGTLLILMVNPMQAVFFFILFQVLQQIEGNLIYPHVVGSSVGLPSMWVLVAVTVGGSLMGVLGMLIFIPMISVLYTLFRKWTYRRLAEKKIRI